MNKMNSNSRRSKESTSPLHVRMSKNEIPKASNVCDLHTFSSREVENLKQQLLSWYSLNKRDLPWRRLGAQETDRNRRGYAVWVSEVMLQQTQVATVIEYYNKWMKRWPSLQDLAKANLEEVNEMWSGLGYYSRARRLHEGSKKVVNDMNGEMPSDAASLMKSLPGVGKYTAAAIASIAFNQPVGLVDGNVVRVLSRLRIIGTDSSSAVAVDMFWKLVTELISKDCPGDFNQAMMELGATVCTPKSPHCSSCPVKETCFAFRQAQNCISTGPKNENEIRSFFKHDTHAKDHPSDNLTDIEELIANNCQLCLPKGSKWDAELGVCNYPRKSKPKEARQERVAVCIVECSTKTDEDPLLFLVKRPSHGLLAGLWEFPNLVVDSDLSDKALEKNIKELMSNQFTINTTKNQKVSLLGNVVHLFSHIHHTYVVHKIVLTDMSKMWTGNSVNGQSTKWVKQSELLEMAVSTAMKKVYNLYKNNGQLKKTGIKRKREEKDKGQRVLESFFVKT